MELETNGELNNPYLQRFERSVLDADNWLPVLPALLLTYFNWENTMIRHIQLTPLMILHSRKVTK